MIQQIAAKVQAPSDKVRLLLNNRCNQIRTMQPKEALNGLEKNLSYNIGNYMGVKLSMINQQQIQEAALFIVQKFPMLGLGDIWEAFKMVGAKQLDVDLRAYYGTFSIIAIGEMLTAYLKYRNTILSKVQDEVEAAEKKAKEEAEKGAKNAEAKQQVVFEYQLALEAVKGKPIFTRWQDVKSHWAKILFEEGLIEELSESEQAAMKAKARKIAKYELDKIIFSDSARAAEKSDARRMLKDVEANKRNEDFVAMWLNIYSKLRVWEYLKPTQK